MNGNNYIIIICSIKRFKNDILFIFAKRKSVMQSSKHIHIVFFQLPYPPVYGGLIDMYYKLKTLHDCGFKITLHTYRYGLASEEKSLDKLADNVYYYERKTGLVSMFSKLPYIINSRRNKQLLYNLLQDDDPILFEGIHTCFFLSHPCLKHRFKWVRMHNIEHEYYSGLAKNTSLLWKKIYFRVEALRLKHYERILNHANMILAITHSDSKYFNIHYSHIKVCHLPCFYDLNSCIDYKNVKPNVDKYVLYHGNLSVEENVIAALRIVELSKSPYLSPNICFVIAGYRPSKKLKKIISTSSNIKLIDTPSFVEMDRLISQAHIHLLLTNQPTGIKLKLLNVLNKGRYGHVLTNSLMLPDYTFGTLCNVANTNDELIDMLNILQDMSVPNELYEYRLDKLKEMGYTNDVSVFLQE